MKGNSLMKRMFIAVICAATIIGTVGLTASYLESSRSDGLVVESVEFVPFGGAIHTNRGIFYLSTLMDLENLCASEGTKGVLVENLLGWTMELERGCTVRRLRKA